MLGLDLGPGINSMAIITGLTRGGLGEIADRINGD